MDSKSQAMLIGSFAADALALGVHWIYNTNVIDRKVGRVTQLLKPIVSSWHPNRDAGEFTHYGDQTLWLLEHLADEPQFDPQRFAERWRARVSDYDGYVDKATRATLERFAAGHSPADSGSDSSDFGGAARVAPLVYRHRREPDALATAARNQTVMTHNHPDVADGAVFLALAAQQILNGTSPVAALEETLRAGFDRPPWNEWLSSGLATAGKDSRQVILEFGQMCDIAAAFPAAIHLVATYENDYAAAMTANCMAGGDSAARGLAAGMLLGAHNGLAAIPAEWRSGMRAESAITRSMERIDARIAG